MVVVYGLVSVVAGVVVARSAVVEMYESLEHAGWPGGNEEPRGYFYGKQSFFLLAS
jgi:hypothetical protein